jgi:hypothetical protein
VTQQANDTKEEKKAVAESTELQSTEDKDKQAVPTEKGEETPIIAEENNKEKDFEKEEKTLSVLSKVIEKVEEYVDELNLKKNAANNQHAYLILPGMMFKTLWEWIQMLFKWRTLFILILSIAVFFVLNTTITDFKQSVIDAFVNNSVLVLSILLILSLIMNVALKTILDMTDLKNKKFHYDMYVRKREREFEVFGPFMKEASDKGEGHEPDFIIKTLDELKENLGKDTYIQRFLKWEEDRNEYTKTIDLLKSKVDEVTKNKKDIINRLEKQITDLESIFGDMERMVISELKGEFSPRLLHFPNGFDVYCLSEGVLTNKGSLWKTGMPSIDIEVDDDKWKEDPRVTVLNEEQYLTFNDDMVTMKFDVDGEVWVFALYLTGDKIDMFNPKSNYGMMNLNNMYGTLLIYCYYFKSYKEFKGKIKDSS